MAALPGFYGKLPVVGDFVQRRMAAEFVERWDRWLQESTLAARAALGADWLACYRAAPAWGFVLAPGCIGYQGWIGLVTPSMDRVGRYFPLTVAQPLPSSVDPLAALIGAGHWFGALEQLARQAIDHGLDVERFDAALAHIGAAPLPAAAPGGEDATMPLPQSGRQAPLAWRLLPGHGYGQLAALVAALRRPALFAGDDPHVVLALDGLPEPALSVALIDGQWAAHGWRYEDHDAMHGHGNGAGDGAGDGAGLASLDLTRPFEPKPT